MAVRLPGTHWLSDVPGCIPRPWALQDILVLEKNPMWYLQIAPVPTLPLAACVTLEGPRTCLPSTSRVSRSPRIVYALPASLTKGALGEGKGLLPFSSCWGPCRMDRRGGGRSPKRRETPPDTPWNHLPCVAGFLEAHCLTRRAPSSLSRGASRTCEPLGSCGLGWGPSLTCLHF